MNGYYWKVKSTHLSRIFLILFSLLASVSFNPSEFFDCQCLSIDEELGFLGIFEDSETQSHSCSVSLFAPSLSASRYLLNSHLLPAAFFSPSMNSCMGLAALMRC